jgi:hypothetical protein
MFKARAYKSGCA